MYFEVFQGMHNYWYWRLLADKNQKIAFCSQGYVNKDDALNGINMIKSCTAIADIKEIQKH